MPAQRILELGDPTLWSVSERVADARTSDVQIAIRDLADTLASFRGANGFGRGIAAPQIGVLRRVIFVRMQPAGFHGALINPEILQQSPDRLELWDDCFSLPNLMVRVSRAARVEVAYEDELGRRQMLRAEGDLSELLQHEIDHLDGILATQRAISPQALCTRAEWLRRNR